MEVSKEVNLKNIGYAGGIMDIVQLNKRYTYDKIMELISMLITKYEKQIVLKVIGESHDKRKIPLLQIGKGKEALICSAGVHGRESVNPLLLLKMVEDYCKASASGEQIESYNVAKLLNQYMICFIPLLNPDGYVIALESFNKIRNPILRQNAKIRNVSHEDWKYNGRGVDINRNFPAKSYVKQSPDDYPISEPETKALINVFHEYPTVAYLDFHSRGKIIYYYRGAMSFLYNQRQQYLAERLKKITNYSLGTKEEELLTKVSGGNTVHYYSEYSGKPAITVETVEEEAEFPLDVNYQISTYEEIHTIPLGLLEMLISGN